MADGDTKAKEGTRKDPLPVFCFKIELGLADFGDPEAAFFKSVSGIKYETEVIPVKEGGSNDTTFQLVGSTKWSNIVLKQGFTGASALMKWREDWLSGEQKRMTRVNGKIIQLNTAMKEMATWQFFQGWPCKWEVGEFDASKSELAIETLEIAHNGIKFGK
jgi:phage tail-like protein